jgi:hypothetical protein
VYKAQRAQNIGVLGHLRTALEASQEFLDKEGVNSRRKVEGNVQEEAEWVLVEASQVLWFQFWSARGGNQEAANHSSYEKGWVGQER